MRLIIIHFNDVNEL